LGVDELEREPVFLEYAGALPDLGDRGILVAALTDGEFQRFVSGGGGGEQYAAGDE